MRIVSLLPAATEIAAALGLGDQVVGISHECDFPPQVASKPRVTRCSFDPASMTSEEIDRRVAETIAARGTLYELDQPLLAELQPDLILTQRLCDVCAVGYGSVAQLVATLPRPPRLVNLEPSCLADVFDNIRAVAAAAEMPSNGERLVAELTRRVEVVRDATSRAAIRPRCLLLEWIEPLYCAGHWNPELVELAGGSDPLGRPEANSVRVQWNQVLEAQPEVIVVSCCGYSLERTRRDLPLLHRSEGWHELAAVRAGRVFGVDGNAYFTRPGPRLIEGLEILAGLLHPQLFPQFAPERWPAERVARFD